MENSEVEKVEMSKADINKTLEKAKLTQEQSKTPSLGFETEEHAKLGPKIDISMGPNGYYLTYGEIIALGGDWYETPEDLINAKQLATESILGAEKVNNRPFSELTNLVSYNLSQIRMLVIANTNTSHFSPQNIKEWETLHNKAKEFAIKAFNSHGRLSKDAVNQILKNGTDINIRNAFLYNAFADHFLSDRFSAGHIRTPAKVLRTDPDKIVPGRDELKLNSELWIAQNSFSWAQTDLFLGYVGYFLVKSMHDEDSENGLNVKNNKGNKWRAYGDNKLESTENKENFERVKEIINLSASSIYGILSSGSSYPSIVNDVINMVPHATSDNPAPMWKVIS